MRVVNAGTEKCVYCGEATDAGIYVRIDPKEAPHPTIFKEGAR